LKGSSFDRAWDKQQRQLWFKNGSWFQFFSNDQDLDKFGGAALHRIVYDEEPRADIRRECLMRLIDYGGEEVFGMTPLNGMSWTYDEIYDPWERGDLVDGRVVVVDMDDNPHLDRLTMARVLAGLSEEERQARKSGRFVAFAGLIYPSFSGEDVIPEVEQVPPGVEVFCGIDPGIRHMCAVVFCYLDYDDTMVVFDEIAVRGETVREVVKEIRLRCHRWGTRVTDGTTRPLIPNWFVIDPAAKNKNNQTGRSDQQEFFDNGIVTIPGQNAVNAGINRVKERLEARKLKVTANCVELRNEFKKYRWVRDLGRSEDEARDRPVKKDDHLLDALRYVVMQRPLTPERDRALPTDTYKDRLLRASLKRLQGLGGSGQAPADHFFGRGQFS
jgi:phage terminase large subunit-like protein